MLEVNRDTNVYTADDIHVGSVDRVVLDPVTQQLTHIVIQKGMFFPEDRLVPFEDISTATPERINLRQDVDAAQLQPFIEKHFVPMDESDLPPDPVLPEPGLVSAWYGPLGLASPAQHDGFATASERNIPDRLLVLDAGLPTFSSDHQVVGSMERVLTTDAGLPTHIVIAADGLSPDRRALPISWVREITEDAIVVAATARMVNAIVPLGLDE